MNSEDLRDEQSSGAADALTRGSQASTAATAAFHSAPPSFPHPNALPASSSTAAAAAQHAPKKSPSTCALPSPPPPPNAPLPSSATHPSTLPTERVHDEGGNAEEELHVTWGDDEGVQGKELSPGADEDADEEWQLSQVRCERAAVRVVSLLHS